MYSQAVGQVVVALRDNLSKSATSVGSSVNCSSNEQRNDSKKHGGAEGL